MKYYPEKKASWRTGNNVKYRHFLTTTVNMMDNEKIILIGL
jgi:hypothetical protein